MKAKALTPNQRLKGGAMPKLSILHPSGDFATYTLLEFTNVSFWERAQLALSLVLAPLTILIWGRTMPVRVRQTPTQREVS